MLPLAVFLIGRLLFFRRPFAHILSAERGGNNQHFAQRLTLLGFQQHPANARVNRQARHFAAKFGHVAPFGNGFQLLQQGKTVFNKTFVRRINKGEILQPAQLQLQHLQNNGGQVGALDFRLGKCRPVKEIAFIVQADANTWRGAATTTGTLVGAGLGNGLHRQALHFAAVTVTGNACHASIHHITDTRHG